MGNYLRFWAMIAYMLGGCIVVIGLCIIAGGMHQLSDLNALGAGIGLLLIGLFLSFIANLIDPYE